MQIAEKGDAETTNSSIEVSPNPAKDEIKISYYGLLKNSNFEILDVSGRLLMQVKINDAVGMQSVSIYNLSAGVYFYRVQFENGTYSSNKLTVVK